MKSGKDIVFYFRPDVISFTWRGKKICHAWQVLLPPFFSVFLEAYFRASFLGVKIRHIPLYRAFVPSFSPLSIYNIIMCLNFFLRFSLKKLPVCFVILWKVSTFAPADEKQRSLRASSLKDFT